MKKLLISVLLFLTLKDVSAQTVYNGRMKTYDSVWYGMNIRVTRDTALWQSTAKRVTFLFMPGNGEVGTDVTRLKIYGIHSSVALGSSWNGALYIAGDSIYPTYISMQPTAQWLSPNSSNFRNAVKAMVNYWQIKPNGFHCSGYSAGAWSLMLLGTYMPNTIDSSFLKIFKTFTIQRGATPTNTYGSSIAYPVRFGNMARTFGSKMLLVEQTLDNRNLDEIADAVNDTVPESGRFLITTYGSGGHSDDVNKLFDYTERNWTTSNPEVNISGVSYIMNSNGIDAGINIYEWAALEGDYENEDVDPENLEAYAIDTTVVFSLSGYTPSFTLRGGVASGTATATIWSFVSGPMTPTLTNSTTLSPTISLINQAGTYIYRFIVSNVTQADTVFVNVIVRNWMLKNVSEVGSRRKVYLGTAIGSGVTTTAIYAPYINRDGIFGAPIVAGDTIVIVKNPNHPQGKWDRIEIGDFGGNINDPVVVMPDSVVVIGSTGGHFRVAIRDSNVVCYTHINGLANRLTKGVVYGFQYDNPSATEDHGAIGFTARLTHHLEVDGMSVINAGLAIFAKVNSDSTYLWQVKDFFRLQKLTFHDMYMHRINGEAAYVGHTDIPGTSQAGNSGPTVMGDSIHFYRMIIDSTSWDGIQISNMNKYAILEYIVAYRTGRTNTGGQQWQTFGGGNTQGWLRYSAFKNGTGPIGWLGKGISYVTHCVLDSSWAGNGTSDGIYATQPYPAVLGTPVDSLELHSDSNYIRNVERTYIRHDNVSTGNYMKPGSIRGNTFVNPGALPVSNAGDTIENNIELASDYDWDDDLINHQSYQVLKRLIANPATKISFFDTDTSILTVDAGSLQAITLPSSTVSLTAIGSITGNGVITGYSWEQIVGPAATIATPNSATTSVTFTTAGTYIFRATVSDDQSRTAIDEVTVIVNPAVESPGSKNTQPNVIIRGHRQ